MHTRFRPRSEDMRSRAAASQEGFSLVEGLMAAALLLVVAVSVLPVFMRAVESNTRGGRASQLTSQVNARLESINQAFISRTEWQLAGDGNSVLATGTDWWDLGALYEEGDPAAIGDERWVVDKNDADGPVLWSRQMDVRKYSFADVHSTISVGGVDFATRGDPRWFDSPLVTEDDGSVYNAHFTEFRVHIIEDREGIPLDSGQRMTVGHYRAF